MPSRKIPREYDNPIDNILVDLSEFLNPYFHRLNFTPNMITTLSLILNTFYHYHDHSICLKTFTHFIFMNW